MQSSNWGEGVCASDSGPSHSWVYTKCPGLAPSGIHMCACTCVSASKPSPDLLNWRRPSALLVFLCYEQRHWCCPVVQARPKDREV